MPSAEQGQTNPGFTLQIRRTFAAPREKSSPRGPSANS
jgi:hypothetical protein